ncbi:MAG: RNA-binding protein [Bacteroidetes bacterium]|nr:RNA-binding protein [Bacteroidota bacterium]|tara:strand:+ start:259 stop:639 length:381 start_codon:yes stop_codon:yes gene_type:complete
MLKSIRIDKWLWAVRVFKTRTMAGDACKSGKVKIDEIQVKASREVKVGDIISIHQGPITKTVRVTQVIKNRVSAKLAVNAMEDLTPPEEYERLKLMNELNYERRDRGIGRPTKKDQRIISKLKNKL